MQRERRPRTVRLAQLADMINAALAEPQETSSGEEATSSEDSGDFMQGVEQPQTSGMPCLRPPLGVAGPACKGLSDPACCKLLLRCQLSGRSGGGTVPARAGCRRQAHAAAATSTPQRLTPPALKRRQAEGCSSRGGGIPAAAAAGVGPGGADVLR